MLRQSIIRAERGSVAPLGIALLLGLVATILGLAAAGHAALTGNRLQALADSAILYAHDRVASNALNATEKQSQLDANLRRYFELASAVGAYRLNYTAEAMPVESKIRVCTEWQNRLIATTPRLICRTAIARSFEVTD